MSTAKTAASAKTATQYISDLVKSRPILADTIDAICSTDDADIDRIISDSGYNLTYDGFYDAVVAKQSGPGFDLGMCGGLYEFTKPEDMKSRHLMVNPANSNIYIDGDATGNRTDQDGQVSWSYKGFKYAVTFDIGYDDSGSPRPHTFAGTRASGDRTESVSGRQIVPSPDEFVLNHPIALTIGFIATVSGVTVTTIVACLWNRIKGRLPWRRDEVMRGREWAVRFLRNQRDTFDPADVHYDRMQVEVEQAINRAVNKYLVQKDIDSSQLTDQQMEEIRKEASVDGTNKLEELAKAMVRAECKHKFGPYAEYVHDEDAVALITRESARRSYKDRVGGLDRKADYLQARVDFAINTAAEQKARENASAYKNAANTHEQEAAEYRKEESTKKTAKETEEQHLRERGKTEAEIRDDPYVQRLSREIKKHEEDARNKDQDAETARKQAETRDSDAEEAKKKAREAKEKADGKAGEIFGKK
ncbi:hypothetical protein NEOLEDRAFT_1173266 [Neolentinus lepideus HHB14362 ss-1]|uniref:Uncharacterized protein n=1 Tax=Neolentinus lepideus HHB14362 ss-1 TaxID=1314782 RepID=A0A165N0N8_9AGAM|nr:hypothetical protein NEOLEDRAFT_1173266 [Neolentinus lepideus HHB14362 ss-1]